MTNSYSLTDDEIILLDGKVGEKVQKEIDIIKESRKLHSHPIVGKALEESLKLGTFSWDIEYTRHCGLCGKSCEYAKHKRSSRDAWGHKKGQTDYSKPLKFAGIVLNRGFISISGHSDFCEDCNKKDKIVETILEEIIGKNMPIEIRGKESKSTKFKKDDERKCYSCKETFYESEAGRLPCLMEGTYPGKCPLCGAEQLMFGRSHDITGNFKMRAING